MIGYGRSTGEERVRARWPLCLALGVAWLAGAEGAAALVGCQTAGGKLKLRPDACKAPKERVAFDAGSDPTGVWRWVSGPPRADTTDTYTESLVLAQDGSGRLHRRARSAGALECPPIAYARSLSATLTIDGYGEDGAELWRGRLIGPDTLELSDAGGELTTFERATAVDPALECVPLVETRRFTGLPAPSDFTGLAFDGVQLWYTSKNSELVQPVDPASGTAGTPVDIGSNYNQVHAVQGGDFWTHCWCGSNEVATRRSPGGGEVDSVDTRADLGDPLNLRALAFDAAAGALWLYGRVPDTEDGRLFRVLSDPEPDQLQQGGPFATRLAALTFDGSLLSGLTEASPRSVVRIDPLAGNVTATYSIAGQSVEWYGIASAGGQLFLVGATTTGEPDNGVLAAFSAPAP